MMNKKQKEVITEIDMSFDEDIKRIRKMHSNFNSFLAAVRKKDYKILPEFVEGFRKIYWE